MGADPVEPLDWQFLQCFGERTPGEEIQEGERRAVDHHIIAIILLAHEPLSSTQRLA